MQSNGLKQRLVGALVLASIAAIFVPMILDGPDSPRDPISESNIPPKPDGQFISKVIPLSGENGQPDGGGRQAPAEPEAKTPPKVKETVPAPSPIAKPAAKPEPKLAPKPVTKPSARSAPKPGKTSVPKPVAKPAPKPAGKPAPRGAPLKAARDVHAWVVQVGSFTTEKNAKGLRDKLRDKGFRAFLDVARTGKGKTYRVRVGPELDHKRAKALRAELEKKMKLKGIVLRHD